ncbi:MAG: cupin domain-containing protein [Methyloceanibacter sp.]
MRKTIVFAGLVLWWTLSEPALSREAGLSESVAAEQLLAEPLAGQPDKQVVTHLYSFPAGAVLPWHFHAGADEIAYVVEGDFAIEIEGKGVKQLKPGESFYLPPNAVHRGMNKGTVPVKLFVVRIKPKDKPLATEVRGPN